MRQNKNREIQAMSDNHFYCQLNSNLDGVHFEGTQALPEDATLKQIKDFQEQCELAVQEVHDSIFVKTA